MAHAIDIDRAQDIIDYRFQNHSLLIEALRAPEKRHDSVTKEVVYTSDGNRCLAQLGHKLIELALIDTWYEAGSDRGLYMTIQAPCPTLNLI